MILNDIIVNYQLKDVHRNHHGQPNSKFRFEPLAFLAIVTWFAQGWGESFATQRGSQVVKSVSVYSLATDHTIDHKRNPIFKFGKQFTA